MAWGSTWQETGQRGETRRGKRCWGGNWKGSVREPSAERAGARCSRPSIARNRKIVNKNLLLVRYSFERLAKSFKRGELQRRWGGKVTIGKTRSKTEVQGKRVRGVTRVVRAGQGARLHGRCEGDSKPAHAKPAYAAAKISPRACRPKENSKAGSYVSTIKFMSPGHKLEGGGGEHEVNRIAGRQPYNPVACRHCYSNQN